MTHHLHIPRSQCLFAECRRLVEEGAEDAPVLVFHDGQHCLTVRSLFWAATRAIAEEPNLRITKYHPHPMGKPPGMRMQALLEASKGSGGGVGHPQAPKAAGDVPLSLEMASQEEFEPNG